MQKSAWSTRTWHVSIGALWLSTLLFACNPEESTAAGGTELSGTYNGQLAIFNTQPTVSGTITFTIDDEGDLTGQLTSTDPATGNEVSSLAGTITGDDPFSLDLELEVDAPQGAFTITGKALFDEGSQSLSGSALTAKDTAGTFVGNAPLTATREPD